jgi:PAS domain S-box-containing protein
LRKSEERFRELAENIPEAFWVTSPDFNRMIYISPAYETIWGRTSKSLYENPRSWIDNIHPDDRDRVTTTLEDHIQGKADFEEEYRIIRPDGTERWIIDHAYSIKGKSGLTDHIIGVAKDITERKRAEEQIKSSLKEKEVLLREIHHRVKNNMQIMASLLRLQSEGIKDKHLLDLFNESQNRIKSMALIHEDLYQSKDFARIDFEQYTRTLTGRLISSYGVDPNRIIASVNIDNVFLDVDKAIPCGLILNELFTNSLKYAFPVDKFGANLKDKKGEIRIDCHSNSAEHTLVFSDNGVGFPENIDFHKTETLGLDLVKSLTRQLGGTIELNRNNGTEFTITFGV